MAKFVVVELSPDAQDNRPLGRSGSFLIGTYGESDIAEFTSREAADDAAARAPNRRHGCELWMNGGKAKVPA